jgi:hypothetical protein
MLEHLTQDHYRLAVLALTWAGCAVNELPEEIAAHARDGLAKFVIAADRDCIGIPDVLTHLFSVAASAAHCRREAKADEPTSAGLARMVAYLSDPPKAEVVEMLSRFMSEVWARVTPGETDKCCAHFEENVFPKFALAAPHLFDGAAH